MSGFNDWLAQRATKIFGSMGMFYALVIWQVGWMTLATLGFWWFRDDQYPFAFCLFLSNLIQLWALPLLGAGTNLQDKHHHKTHALHESHSKELSQVRANMDVLYDLVSDTHTDLETLLAAYEVDRPIFRAAAISKVTKTMNGRKRR